MKIESIIVRDPDGETDEYLFMDGKRVYAQEYVIDAGAGWTWADWCEHRDNMLDTARMPVREQLCDLLDDPPGGQYITGRNGQPWL